MKRPRKKLPNEKKYGLFVPKEIVELVKLKKDPRKLTHTEAVLLTKLYRFSMGPQGCTASNEALCKELRLSKDQTRGLIRKFERRGLIERKTAGDLEHLNGSSVTGRLIMFLLPIEIHPEHSAQTGPHGGNSPRKGMNPFEHARNITAGAVKLVRRGKINWTQAWLVGLIAGLSNPRCWSSNGYLAKETGLSKRAVSRALSALSELGLLETSYTSSGRRVLTLRSDLMRPAMDAE